MVRFLVRFPCPFVAFRGRTPPPNVTQPCGLTLPDCCCHRAACPSQAEGRGFEPHRPLRFHALSGHLATISCPAHAPNSESLVEPTSLLGPIKLAWDKLVWDRLVDRARGKLVVRVRIHHAYLDGQEPAFFINVQNQSPQRSAMVTHVWLEMTQDVPILSKPLPRKIDPNSEWETFIPKPSSTTPDPLPPPTMAGDLVRILGF